MGRAFIPMKNRGKEKNIYKDYMSQKPQKLVFQRNFNFSLLIYIRKQGQRPSLNLGFLTSAMTISITAFSITTFSMSCET
jgi:hypothetical protein